MPLHFINNENANERFFLSVPAKSRVRWHSFQRQHRIKYVGIQSPQIESLSVAQIATLQKFCLLKLTALMEKYAPTARSSNWNL